jgi:hypothetical protein
LFPQALERKKFLMLEGYGVTLSEIGVKNGKVMALEMIEKSFH